ncbi:glutamine amidotransferase-related protein [Deminuibacter soli]|nr:gamma-glutamyl-gamma-aminobutyrate hydrolase family protein [Deminuibacter soli]
MRFIQSCALYHQLHDKLNEMKKLGIVWHFRKTDITYICHSNTCTMNVHVLQHVSFEGPEFIADWCAEKGHHLTYTRFYQPGAPLPTQNDVDFLVIMGGPMGVYDTDIYPWLQQEKDFITAFLTTNKPVLGICLGAQLLSVCAGAAVQPAPQKEIGWFPVMPVAATTAVPWLQALLQHNPVLFHWHGDRFNIPAGAVNLAATAANDNQAFLLGNNQLALQFHAEVKPDGMQRMITAGLDELQPGSFIQSADTITGKANFSASNTIMRGMLEQLVAAGS